MEQNHKQHQSTAVLTRHRVEASISRCRQKRGPNLGAPHSFTMGNALTITTDARHTNVSAEQSHTYLARFHSGGIGVERPSCRGTKLHVTTTNYEAYIKDVFCLFCV